MTWDLSYFPREKLMLKRMDKKQPVHIQRQERDSNPPPPFDVGLGESHSSERQSLLFSITVKEKWDQE